jgi:hypothetical protein
VLRSIGTRNRGALSAFALVSIATAIGCLQAACGSCPAGTSKSGDVCVKPGSDAGIDAGATTSRANAVTAVSGAAGTAGGLASPPSDGSAPQVIAGRGGGASPAKSDRAGAGDGAGAASSAGKGGTAALGNMSSSGAPSPCQGRAGETVCDKMVMNHCGPDGTAQNQEACMSELFCQLGMAAGKCAVCNPSSATCEGAELDKCNDSGQVEPQQCPSAALCNASASACTDLVCMPDTKTCTSDGSLQICNHDGSAVLSTTPCPSMCDAANARCNSCVPNSASCQGDSTLKCSADGQSTQVQGCLPSGECATATCSAGNCVQGIALAGSPCSSGRHCDLRGDCVECSTASDCPAPSDCQSQACNAGTCAATPKPKGATCMAGQGVCDGSGTCGAKPCGNGVVDPGEQCDPTAPEWIQSGVPPFELACDQNCMRTASVYRDCSVAGQLCWTDAPWRCSPAGVCSTVCQTASDCSAARVATLCTSAPTGGGLFCASQCSSCYPGLGCANYNGVMMCGWVSTVNGMTMNIGSGDPHPGDGI